MHVDKLTQVSLHYPAAILDLVLKSYLAESRAPTSITASALFRLFKIANCVSAEVPFCRTVLQKLQSI